MNCDASKPVTSPDYHPSNKSLNKSKRKRRRNKFRYSNAKTKKKYQRKFNNKLDFCSSLTPNIHQFIDNIGEGTRKVMSNWYWSNYKKAIEWQDKHKIAHWKACALALQEENKYLLQIINNMRPGLCPNLRDTPQNLNKRSHVNKINTKTKNTQYSVGNASSANDEETEDIEFEMSEEMIQFFEQSFKHKMDLEKMKKEKEELNAEEEVKQIQTNRWKRSSEMQALYGDQASMITGMETAVQLSFEKYCDTKSPKYWPNIPFRL